MSRVQPHHGFRLVFALLVHGLDAPRTIGLLAIVGGVVGGFVALLHSIAAGFGNIGN